MRLRDEVVNSRIGRRRGELEWVRRCGIEVPELCRRCEKEDGCKEEGGWIEVWEAVVTNYHTRIVADLMPGIPGQNVETVEGKYRWASRTLVIHLDFEVGFAHYPVEPREDLFVGRWTEGYLDGKEEGMLVDSRSWFDVITRRSADSGELEVQAPEDDDDD